MLVTPESIWLVGHAPEILQQLKKLQNNYEYVRDIVTEYYPA